MTCAIHVRHDDGALDLALDLSAGAWVDVERVHWTGTDDPLDADEAGFAGWVPVTDGSAVCLHDTAHRADRLALRWKPLGHARGMRVQTHLAARGAVARIAPSGGAPASSRGPAPRPS